MPPKKQKKHSHPLSADYSECGSDEIKTIFCRTGAKAPAASSLAFVLPPSPFFSDIGSSKHFIPIEACSSPSLGILTPREPKVPSPRDALSVSMERSLGSPGPDAITLRLKTSDSSGSVMTNSVHVVTATESCSDCSTPERRTLTMSDFALRSEDDASIYLDTPLAPASARFSDVMDEVEPSSPLRPPSTTKSNPDKEPLTKVNDHKQRRNPYLGLGVSQSIFVMACVRKLLEAEQLKHARPHEKTLSLAPSSSFASRTGYFIGYAPRVIPVSGRTSDGSWDVTRSTFSTRAKMASPRGHG